MNPYSYVRDISVRLPTAAQSAMERALLELYCRKELSAISVKELCSKASVARSTFYAYYNVIDDCMLSIEDRLISELVRLNDELMGADELKDLDFFSRYNGVREKQFRKLHGAARKTSRLSIYRKVEGRDKVPYVRQNAGSEQRKKQRTDTGNDSVRDYSGVHLLAQKII